MSRLRALLALLMAAAVLSSIGCSPKKAPVTLPGPATQGPGAVINPPAGDSDQPAPVKALLKSLDLATEVPATTFGVTVPLSWEVKLGEYPIGIYWGLANEVSKDAGYDLTGLKGKTVSAWKARLIGGLQPRDRTVDFHYPTDVIVLLDGDNVAGAWLSWNTSIVGPSLRKRWFEDISGLSFEQWVLRESYFMDAGENGDLGAMKPEEVLAAFFEAIDERDKTRAYACLTPRAMSEMLMNNKSDGCLYNQGPAANNSLVENIVSGKLLSWTYYDPDRPRDTLTEIDGRTRIGVRASLELKWRDAGFNSPDGHDGRFAIMSNDGLGWKLDGLGTGP